MQTYNIIKKYLGFVQDVQGLSDSTVSNYNTYLNRLKEFILSYYRTDDITVLDLEGFGVFLGRLRKMKVSKQSRYYKLGGTMDSNTVRYHAMAVRKFLKRCRATGIHCLHPDLITLPKLQRRKVPYLSREQISLLFDMPMLLEYNKLIEYRNKLLLYFGYYCGLRIQESLNLKLSEVKKSKGLLHIVGKGSQDRQIVINDETMNQVEKYDFLRNVRLKEKHQSDNLFICFDSAKKGRQLSQDGVGLLLKRYSDELSFGFKITYHLLRHSHATHLHQSGVDLKTIQQMMGHKSIESTQIYTHVNTDSMIEAQKNLLI